MDPDPGGPKTYPVLNPQHCFLGHQLLFNWLSFSVTFIDRFDFITGGSLIDFLCFRTVASLDNGDIVVGTNDGTIRIFSRDPSRYNQLNYTVRGSSSRYGTSYHPVLWNRNYLLRFRFRFWLLKSYGSGSNVRKVMVPVPVPTFEKVTVPVPVPGPYLDHKKQINKKIWKFFWLFT